MVADDAVVGDVGVGQHPVVVADAGDAAAAAGAAVDGDELAEQVVLADFQLGAFAGVLLVLRVAADGGVADEAVALADAGRSGDGSMRADVATIADAHDRADQGERADAHVLAEGRLPKNWLPKNFPKQVFVSFDLDAFDPAVIPATGTPVPGGLGWRDALKLIDGIAAARKIVGFDVVELAPLKHLQHPDYTAALLVYALMAAAARS